MTTHKGSSFLTKGLKRSALSVALGMCFAGGVQAQSAVGSVFGETVANTTVKIENLETGLSREITADSSGRFSFPQLSPGRYRVSAGAATREVRVNVGTGSHVAFVASEDATTLDAVEVIGAGAINPIDVSSVESTTVFTQEQIRSLPVGRSINEVALLAPGTVRGDAGLGSGNLASFGGASVAENGYYINGFDVTDLRNLVSYADLPFDAISEQQVRTGGYGAEYGRSLGGVIGLVTKRGTNEWKGGVSVYWTPKGLRAAGRDVRDRDPDAPNNYTRYVSHDQTDELSYNVYAGGPIIKDRLFVFGLVEGVNDQRDDFGQNNSTKTTDKEPNGMVKLDWNITDNHLLEFTGIRNKVKEKTLTYSNDRPYSTTHDGAPGSSTFESGGHVYIGKYTGYLTDNFTVSAQYGEVESLTGKTSGGDSAAALCPAVYDTPGLTYVGCWDINHFTVLDPFAPDNEDTRKAWRIDLDWQLGDHHIRAGYDAEKFTSTNAGTTYSGGVYWRYFNRPGDGMVNGVLMPAEATQYVRKRLYQTTTGSFEVENTAAYIEDSWQINDRWVVYAGVRAETFDNKNGDGQSFIKADNMIAPRLGFSWDVYGDSTFKIFGNAGRYYIPVAANTNIRASSAEEFWNEYYTFDGKDPTTGAPTGTLTQLGPRVVTTAGTTPDPRTVADQDLNPMHQDEYILGAQISWENGLTTGLRAVYRKVQDGMDDYCSPYAIYNYAQDNGYTDYDVHSAAPCLILNPGRDVKVAVDLENNGNYRDVVIPASYWNLPKYRRTYSAIEFFWEKVSDRWSLQGSYTWSRSKGNVEGYVNSTLDQDDPGLTQEFDYSSFQDGTFGYLPNDRAHVFKLFGTYKITDEWRVGGNVNIQSGRPRSCQGFVPDTVPDFDPIDGLGGAGSYSSAATFYCVNENGDSVLTPRGSLGRTPWSSMFNASIAYTPSFADGKLTLQADVFNLLNSDTVLEYNEVKDRSRQTSEINPNYGNPTSFQTPRYVRLTVRYEF